MMRIGWLLLWSATVFAQADPKTSQAIPTSGPSGPYAIGRVSYDWVDSSRSETLSKIPNTPREIVVDVWYPAARPQPNAHPGPYFPNAGKIDQSPYAEAEIREMGNLWPMIVSGKIQSHAYDGAPMATGRSLFPLLIFSHAIGGEPYLYAHQIEELVTQGYIVASIHHTYEAAVTVFPDGRMIPLSQENFQRSRVEGPEDISNERKWENERFEVWAGDMRFTLDQITRLNTAPGSGAPFAGRVDLARVGVFGHSFGGIAVGRACEVDQRFKACLNQDGMGDDGPLQHYPGGHRPTQPFMLMRSPAQGPPSDADLKAMQLTRKQFEQDRAEAIATLHKELQGCSGGAYQVWIETPGFRHGSFGDLDLLRASSSAADTVKALQSLRTVEAYTLAFFDKYLNGAKATLLDLEPANGSNVTIERYVEVPGFHLHSYNNSPEARSNSECSCVR